MEAGSLEAIFTVSLMTKETDVSMDSKTVSISHGMAPL
jgi:hypothetical protein